MIAPSGIPVALTFSRIKNFTTVDKEKIFHSDWTNKKRCVKIEHPRSRGIKIEIQKGQFKDLYIHALYELIGMQTAPLVSLCVDV